MSEQITPDPWIYPGCPCLVWRDKDQHKTLAFFKMIGDCNLIYFRPDNNLNEIAIPYKNYKPISPWDFAPPEANFIQIDENGNCDFFRQKDDLDSMCVKRYSDYFGELETYYQNILIPWPACPAALKGKTWPRPEWAKV